MLDVKHSLDDVDQKLPLKDSLIFGLQHVLVMSANPITAILLVAGAVGLSIDVASSLISAAFLVCGIGTLLQSSGYKNFGAKLPFIMIPGGAPIFIFIAIATQTDIQTASGAVIMTACFYFLALPFFTRIIKYFPPIVIGVMLLLVSIKLIKLFGGMILGQANDTNYASIAYVGIAFTTIFSTVIFACLLKGGLQRVSIMLGLLFGTLLAYLGGFTHFSDAIQGNIVALPTPFPFGMPKFDIIASLPMIVFSIISMAEATGQTVAVSKITGRSGDPLAIVPRTIRGDGIASLLGGIFGTSLIITSGENIGIVRATNVSSRYVTLAAGIILIVISFFSPLGRIAAAIPAPVIGGTALIIFAIIGVIAINILKDVDLHDNANMYTISAGILMGLMPTLVPDLYIHFPKWFQMFFGNGLASGTITAVLIHILFELKRKHSLSNKKIEPAPY